MGVLESYAAVNFWNDQLEKLSPFCTNLTFMNFPCEVSALVLKSRANINIIKDNDSIIIPSSPSSLFV